jgi:alpha-beta hydrolase superfamily lysophospholipase
MKQIPALFLQHIFRLFIYGAPSVILLLLIGLVLYLEGRPDLQIWHTTELDEEFTIGANVQTFNDYLALENRLFAQLDQLIYQQSDRSKTGLIQRYKKTSLVDPTSWHTNWNRSFELPLEQPKAAVLLLHGMSDSPYSLRAIAQQLHQADAWVLGLRLPGHGTAPSGLVTVKWQDMAATVKLAMTHLKEQVGDHPIYIVGYSNGGALAVHYALLTLQDSDLPTVNGLVLISPSIGVTKVAALAVWQARLGYLLGLDKVAWNSIQPEYDPYKYNSFAVNAGDQVYRLTANIQSQFKRLQSGTLLDNFPPIIAFQSAIDTTVLPSAVVSRLFEQLPDKGHELVLFDIHRQKNIEHILRQDPKVWFDELLNRASLPFNLSILSNHRTENSPTFLLHRSSKNNTIEQSPLAFSWPNDLYSLSHIALQISPQDPIYGITSPDEQNNNFNLSNIALRGELAALQVSAADMLRLRWNPFFPYVSQRILEFTNLQTE